MGKLGRKARKFARKNLQSIERRKRKQRSLFKRKAPSVKSRVRVDESERTAKEQTSRGPPEGIITEVDIPHNILCDALNEDSDDFVGDSSDSDGFLSEDSECPYICGSEKDNTSEENSGRPSVVGQNKELELELVKHKKKLESLLEKDPKFAKYLDQRKALVEKSSREEFCSDEGVTESPGKDVVMEGSDTYHGKPLSSHTIDVWCWLAMEEPKSPALHNLLNGFNVACRYGIDSSENSSWIIQSREAFSKIVTFILLEADGIFRRMLGISGSGCKDGSLNLRGRSEWASVRQLVKSYLRSSLLLLNQVTDSAILIFALARLRTSLQFFADFPALSGRLIKILLHLWATGDEKLSLSSFLVLRDVASGLSPDWLEICLTKLYRTFLAHNQFFDPDNSKHMEFLMDSVVELYSLDIQRSYQKILLSVQQLTYVLRQALKTKNKEDLKKISSWQYIHIIKLWVKYISYNIKDHDIQQLLFLLIEAIRGMAHLFPGPHYIPLRLKCVQMLNDLSSSSGVFIPITCLVLDCLEQRASNVKDTRHEQFDLALVLKVPKRLIKSQYFHEKWVLSVIEILAAHFAQWSYHVSFPDLATIPLILLKRFHDNVAIESLRHPVKRLIDQVERNIEFVEKKRDEVTFLPTDHAAVESFLQAERSASTPFTQYYASVSRNLRSR